MTKTNAKTSEKVNVYQMVTDRVIAQMQQGIIPWHQPWTGMGGAVNYVTRKPYSFLNQLLLGRDGEWMTFKQVKQMGGAVKKGAKAGMVVFYSPFKVTKVKEDKNGEKKEVVEMIPILKYYHVFHISDTTGIESKMGERTQVINADEQAEAIINGYVSRENGLTFKNDVQSAEAYYRPATDTVVVPMLSQYDVMEEYYSTAFHELTHSTMTESRCNRGNDIKNKMFGSDDYSREELVAELGSAMLCTVAGLDNEKAFKNSVAYLQAWLQALKNDPKMIVWASSRAEKAARYIMGE